MIVIMVILHDDCKNEMKKKKENILHIMKKKLIT